MKKTFLFLILVLLFCPVISSAQNNKFGIHLAVPHDEDLLKAAQLVNSNGGDYGYITLVIEEKNRDTKYWQQIFDKLREYRLIPIIRIATQPEGAVWRAPQPEDAAQWAQFLDSLHWITRDRHVILFNEPNHASEWGGTIDATSYGKVAAYFAVELKNASPDFLIMLAGLDLSAPQQPPAFGDALTYLTEAQKSFCAVAEAENTPCADLIDAISSHSYPNPGFAGSPFESGRRSVRGYETEIVWFQNLFNTSFPVYITETGWNTRTVGQKNAAAYFESAFSRVWLRDERVKAVTPFILNYQSEPFLQFSLVQPGGQAVFPAYTTIQTMQKTAGKPDIDDVGEIEVRLPRSLVTLSNYPIRVTVRNTGQALWRAQEGYVLKLKYYDGQPLVSLAENVVISELKPFEEQTVQVQLVTSASSGLETVGFVIEKGNRQIASSASKEISVITPPTLVVKASLAMKGFSTGSDFELQIFDKNERLVYKYPDFKLTLGRGLVGGVSNIVIGEPYRVVLLKPYYLPRQQTAVLSEGENSLVFEPMLPLDFNQDGKLSIGDVGGLVRMGATGSAGTGSTRTEELSFFEKLKLLLP